MQEVMVEYGAHTLPPLAPPGQDEPEIICEVAHDKAYITVVFYHYPSHQMRWFCFYLPLQQQLAPSTESTGHTPTIPKGDIPD